MLRLVSLLVSHVLLLLVTAPHSIHLIKIGRNAEVLVTWPVLPRCLGLLLLLLELVLVKVVFVVLTVQFPQHPLEIAILNRFLAVKVR